MTEIKFTPFDLVLAPLEGSRIIEASAGTGKTFTISRIFLRLLLEKELPVSSILVVTFSEAAATELKERIQKVLYETREYIQNDHYDDPLIEKLVKKFSRDKAEFLINSAIQNFYTVSIFTIHGFCYKILKEFALELSIAEKDELITDQKSHVLEIIHDFWRISFETCSEFFAQFVISSNISPERWVDISKTCHFKSVDKIVPEIQAVPKSDAEKEYCRIWQLIIEQISLHRDEIKSIFNENSLHKNIYRTNKINAIHGYLDNLKESTPPPYPLPEVLTFCSSSKIKSATKKGENFKTHYFTDLVDELLLSEKELSSQFEKRLNFFESQLINEFLPSELQKRKRNQNVLYFDDLLEIVYRAVSHSESKHLIDSVTKLYRAVCIDEFQDTDKIQYSIFSKLFNNSKTPFIMIGDPKQSIYGFRGADIFNYHKAVLSARYHNTLSTNYRSNPAYLNTINALFLNRSQPFILDNLRYFEVAAGKELKAEALVIEEVTEPTLKLFISTSIQPGKKPAWNKTTASKMVIESVCQEIKYLLYLGNLGKAHIENKPIQPSTIACLVRSNAQAVKLYDALTSQSIPAVIESSNSVFATTQALDIYYLLKAALNPSQLSNIKTALSRPVFNKSMQDIDLMNNGDESADNIISEFFEYHHLWKTRGIMVMFKTIMQHHKMMQNLLKRPYGERALINYNHIIEILHNNESQGLLPTMESVVKSLSNKILQEPDDVVSDEEIERLESDSNAVKIVTIHKSKGLEYPIIFCPFCWEGDETQGNASSKSFLFQDPESGTQTLVLGSEEKKLLRSKKDFQDLQESIRTFYVALTRAKSCCYLYFGNFSSYETSACAYIIHNLQGIESTSDMKNQLETQLPEKIKSDCVRLESLVPGSIKTYSIENKRDIDYSFSEKVQPEGLIAPDWNAKVESSWRITSFTGLTQSSTIDYGHSDEISISNPTSLDESSSEKSIFTFPSGANAGNFFHKLLENLDFTNFSSQGTQNLILETLQEFDIDSSWLPIIEKQLHLLMNQPLNKSQPNLILNNIKSENCCKEMEFIFPIKSLNSKDLKELFAEESMQQSLFTPSYTAETLEFTEIQGYMRGFVDLFFMHNNLYYIIDWKSNLLGQTIDFYDQSSLAQAMIDNHYTLQYHIYTVACMRYLRNRLPSLNFQKMFGGIYYIFLRGLSDLGNPEFGIFHAKPSWTIIQALDTCFSKEINMLAGAV